MAHRHVRVSIKARKKIKFITTLSRNIPVKRENILFVLRVFRCVYKTSLANVFLYPIIILDENTPRLHILVELPTLISASVASLFIVISLTTAIVVICLCRMKRSKKKPEDDEETGNVPTKVIPCIVQNKMAIPVMPNSAYAFYNNMSRHTRVPVYSNEAYAMFNGDRREHKVTEDRKDTSKQGKTHTVLPYAVFEIIPLPPGVKKLKNLQRVVTTYPTKGVPVYPNEAYSVCKGVTRK